MEYTRIEEGLPTNNKKVIVWFKKDSWFYKYGPWMEANYFFDANTFQAEGGLTTIPVENISCWGEPDEPK